MRNHLTAAALGLVLLSVGVAITQPSTARAANATPAIIDPHSLIANSQARPSGDAGARLLATSDARRDAVEAAAIGSARAIGAGGSANVAGIATAGASTAQGDLRTRALDSTAPPSAASNATSSAARELATRDASMRVNAAAMETAIRPAGASATTNVIGLSQAVDARERGGGGAAEAGAKASGAAVAASVDPMRMAALSVAPSAAVPAALALLKPGDAGASATPRSAIGGAAVRSKPVARQIAVALAGRRTAMNAKFLTNAWRGRAR